MREINPHAETAIARFATIAAIENAYIADEADNLIKVALIQDWNVCRVYDAEKLKVAPDALLRRIIIKLSADMLGDPRGDTGNGCGTVSWRNQGEERSPHDNAQGPHDKGWELSVIREISGRAYNVFVR